MPKLLSPLITPILMVIQTVAIALFGYYLSGQQELALKDRNATIHGLTAMSALVEKMQASDSSESIQRLTVNRLSMYGEDSIFPLFIMAAGLNPYQASIPIGGLRMVATNHHESVCRTLRRGLQAYKAIVPQRLEAITELYRDLKCESVVEKEK